MATLKEQMEKLTSLKHRLAVWEALHAYLDEEFAAKDGGGPQRAIKVPNCSVEVVPTETIEDVLQAIGDGPISDLREQISDIENQEVVILAEAKAQA